VPVALDLGTGWAVAVGVAAGIVAIGGAVAYGHRLLHWLAPSEPSVSLSHPTEDHLPWAFGLGGSDARALRYKRRGRSST
jgi:hypothetical protein